MRYDKIIKNIYYEKLKINEILDLEKNDKNRAKLYFAIIIVFWTLIILAASSYIVPSNPINNKNDNKDYGNKQVIDYNLGQLASNNILGNNTTKCQFILPDKKIIILRMDDVQKYAWSNLVMNITNEILKRDMSITLGVIPNGIGQDKNITKYLRAKIKDPRIEIAQHGTNHLEYEYKYLNGSATYDLALSGFEEMIKTLRIRPTTFIPPNNEYNEHMTEELSKLGFTIISTKDEYKFDGDMFHIGLTIQTKYLENEELVPIKDILSSCNVSIDQKNICVINIHPEDFVYKNGNLDKNKYKKFIKLLNELEKLKKLDIEFKTFKDLIKCKEEKQRKIERMK